jgi:hypothetical protein
MRATTATRQYRTTCVDVWHVIHTGVPMLPSNPMATDVMGHSLVPLLESNGRCFGVLLSGSPKANPVRERAAIDRARHARETRSAAHEEGSLAAARGQPWQRHGSGHSAH